MLSKRSLENIYIALLLPLAACALGWAVYNFPAERLDWRLGGLAIIAVLFSSFLRIQLPKTKVHVTTSDAAIILSFLWYGGETAIILSFLQTAFTSLSYRWQGGAISSKTVSVNISIAIVALFVTTMIVRGTFGSAPEVFAAGDVTKVILLIALMASALFLWNSALVSLFFAAKSDKSVFSVWSEYCLNTLVMYIGGAFMAGLGAKAISRFDALMIFVALAISAVVY
ncbi:MAG: hypothetical protein ABJB34_07075, partial [Acidobacteriota bacterium]